MSITIFQTKFQDLWIMVAVVPVQRLSTIARMALIARFFKNCDFRTQKTICNQKTRKIEQVTLKWFARHNVSIHCTHHQYNPSEHHYMYNQLYRLYTHMLPTSSSWP